MRSFVREHIKSIHSMWEKKRRRDVVRGVIGVRLSHGDMEILNRLATHFGISRTGMSETLLEDAIKDAAEELGLWTVPENDMLFDDYELENIK